MWLRPDSWCLFNFFLSVTKWTSLQLITKSFLLHIPSLSLFADRFRQIEVLQQVTTAFNSLVGGVVPGAPVESQLSEEAKVRRRRVGMLFRNASKKSLSQLANSRNQQPLPPSLAGQSSSPELPGDLYLDKRILLKRASLSPLVEEQPLVSEGTEPTETTTLPQVKSSSPRAGRELKNVTSASSSAKSDTGIPAESFELEEVILMSVFFLFLLLQYDHILLLYRLL